MTPVTNTKHSYSLTCFTQKNASGALLMQIITRYQKITMLGQEQLQGVYKLVQNDINYLFLPSHAFL
jgi:hypothetical protein